jgi:hypothetical protein
MEGMPVQLCPDKSVFSGHLDRLDEQLWKPIAIFATQAALFAVAK